MFTASMRHKTKTKKMDKLIDTLEKIILPLLLAVCGWLFFQIIKIFIL